MTFCAYSEDDRDDVVGAKKATGAALFLLFLLYTLSTVIAELKRETKVSTMKSSNSDRIRMEGDTSPECSSEEVSADS